MSKLLFRNAARRVWYSWTVVKPGHLDCPLPGSMFIVQLPRATCHRILIHPCSVEAEAFSLMLNPFKNSLSSGFSLLVAAKRSCSEFTLRMATTGSADVLTQANMGKNMSRFSFETRHGDQERLCLSFYVRFSARMRVPRGMSLVANTPRPLAPAWRIWYIQKVQRLPLCGVTVVFILGFQREVVS